MLLVPVEDQGSWQRPPLLIILLVLINVLVHIGTESRADDQDRQLENRLEEDQQRLLVKKEWSLFLDFTENRDPELWLELRDTAPDERFQTLLYHAWWQDDFSDFVHRHWQTTQPSTAWRRARREVETWRADDPVFKWGLVPKHPDPVSLFTHMFMHGGWGHLFGNMLFLLLFGVPMERHWGARRLLPLYLLSGLAAAGLYILTHRGSDTGLVGASGAISGLMGIYCASYGFRRIEFFYTLGFLFGSFRAPAFAVFPLWVGWELLQKLLFDTNVAYMAHVGGLLGGLTLTLLLRRLWPPPQTPESEPEPGADRDGKRPEPVPAIIEGHARELEFDRALALSLRRLEAMPDWPLLWFFAIDMAPRAESGSLDRLVRLAVQKHHQGEIDQALLVRLWKQISPENREQLRQRPAAFLVLAEALHRQGHDQLSRALLARIDKTGFTHARLDRLRRQIMRPPA